MLAVFLVPPFLIELVNIVLGELSFICPCVEG